MNKDLSKQIIATIKKSKIQPIKKSYFIAKKTLIFGCLMVFTILGAIAFWIILWYSLEADWFLQKKLWFVYLISNMLPVFWLLFLCVCILLIYIHFKNTSRWYKFYIWQILLWGFIFTWITWAAFYGSWISKNIENVIENNTPKFIQNIVGTKKQTIKHIWQNEEKWLLIWKVIGLTNYWFSFEDSIQNIWNVYTSEGQKNNLKIWEYLKIIGEKKWNSKFIAEKIIPISKNFKNTTTNHIDENREEDDDKENEIDEIDNDIIDDENEEDEKNEEDKDEQIDDENEEENEDEEDDDSENEYVEKEKENNGHKEEKDDKYEEKEEQEEDEENEQKQEEDEEDDSKKDNDDDDDEASMTKNNDSVSEEEDEEEDGEENEED